jgi:SAM-dependent methyltransferase
MARAGYDVYRDLFNTPTFLRNLPAVDGLTGLDIGCGEGHNTRLLAGQGARMSAVDITEAFIRYARAAEAGVPLGIQYKVASALKLPFDEEEFDFATAFMSFQDMPQQELAFREAFRVLKPGGFLQFSITHPCFQTPKWSWIMDESDRRVAMTVGDYFDHGECRVDEWTFGAAPPEVQSRYPKFRVAYFDHTLSEWLNMLLRVGFQLEAFAEPTPSNEVLQRHPGLYDARIIAYFLIVRCRKGSVMGGG